MFNRKGFENDLQEIPQLARGKVWCCECGREQKVEAIQAMRNGWPKCCGYTMTIDSPAERENMKKVRDAPTL